MKVWFDHQVFTMQVHGGVSRYFIRLAQEFQRHGMPEVSIVAPLHINRGLEEFEPSSVTGMRLPPFPGSGRVLRSFNRVAMRVMRRPRAPDIYHATYYYPPAGAFSRRKSRLVVTVYDMIHEKYPQFFKAHDHTSKHKARAIKAADQVICISSTTRNDLLDYYQLDENKVAVTHLGAGLQKQAADCESGVTGPYLLFVGERGGYKNFEQLLRAYASEPRINEYCSLVCFGGGAFSSQERKFVAELRLSNQRVVQISGDDILLHSLYRHAEAFVCPSLYEGFGIPNLEAMSLDCPVISSTGGSLPEVVGDAACMFDPHNFEAIAAAINKVLGDPEYRQELVARGRERVRHFSWEKCARQTLDLYRKLI